MALEFKNFTNILPYTNNGRFNLNPSTRELIFSDKNIPIPIIGAKNDHAVEHLIITLPRYYETLDLATATEISTIYTDIETGTLKQVQITNDFLYADNETIGIDWLIGHQTTTMPGELYFSICIRQTNVDSINWEFNSQDTVALIVNSLCSDSTLIPTDYNPTIAYDSWKGTYITFNPSQSSLNPIDSDNVLYIEPTTREILGSLASLGAKGDHNVKYIYIQIPEEYENITFPVNTWDFYVHYKNALGQNDTSKLFKYVDANTNKAYGVWLVPIGATIAAGSVEFSVSFIQTTTEAEKTKIVRALYTQPYYSYVEDSIHNLEDLEPIIIADTIKKDIANFFTNNSIIIDANLAF